MPVRVWRAPPPAPKDVLTGEAPTDEVNGARIAREVTLRPVFELLRGSLPLVAVVNTLGFERHGRLGAT